MATTNPNVPASQETAATTATSPEAKVMSNQPAQVPPGQTTTPSGAVPTNTIDQGQPAQGKSTAQEDSEKMKKAMADVKNMDYFEQQEAFAKMFEEREGEDGFRRQARFEREREAFLSSGDPTRDPVAKQKAMDMNTPAPGAVEEAQAMKDATAKQVSDDIKKHQ